jgi:hypothetical protein
MASVRNALSTTKTSEISAPDHALPYGTVLSGSLSQALRAWLRSCCPSGTKYILRVEALIKLALMRVNPGLNGSKIRNVLLPRKGSPSSPVGHGMIGRRPDPSGLSSKGRAVFFKEG